MPLVLTTCIHHHIRAPRPELSNTTCGKFFYTKKMDNFMQESPKFQCLIFNSTTDQGPEYEVIVCSRNLGKSLYKLILCDKKNAHFIT